MCMHELAFLHRRHVTRGMECRGYQEHETTLQRSECDVAQGAMSDNMMLQSVLSEPIADCDMNVVASPTVM